MISSEDQLAMSKTGLQFYRKVQELEDLKVERPKSIAAVRQALKKAVDKMEADLQTVEREFYGGATCDDDIRAIKPHVRRLCTTFNLTYIHGAYQLDELLAQCRDLAEEDESAIDRHTLELVSRYHEKIRDFVPARFERIIKEAEEAIGFMEKYLLSYYANGDSNKTQSNNNNNGRKDVSKKDDQYMETAIHYEEKRNELKDAILSHLRNITYMSRMYYDRGTPVKVFGLAINELARRRDCGDLPFLLVFPQCCQNIRNACQGIRKWIESDEQYAGFLACDVVDLERKRDEQLQRMREAQQRHFVLEHRLKRVGRELKELEGELERLKERERDNQRQVELLQKDAQMMALEVEMLEEEREQLREKDKLGTVDGYDDRMGTIAGKISQLRYSIPAKKLEISDARSKISFITDKRELYAEKRKLFAQLKHDATYTKMAAAIEEVEMDRIVRCLEALRYIYLLKTSPASTRHIFHKTKPKVKIHPDKVKPTQGRILKPSRRPPVVEERDELEKATHVVASRIDGDWPKLYRSLPFYPPRGHHNIDEDVTNIVQERMRVADRVKAEDSLHKWRRVHTRANLNDLKETLLKMNRVDVLNSIEKQKKQRCNKKNVVQKKWQNLRTLQLITTRISHYKSTRMFNVASDKLGKKLKLPRIVTAKQN